MSVTEQQMLTPWFRILVQKLMRVKLVGKFPHWIEPEFSLLF
jgi:hypothetical protein